MSKPTRNIDPVPGDRVREVRGDMSQEKFAELIELEPVSVSRIETGKQNLTIERAKKICELFPDIRIQWLLHIDDVKTKSDESTVWHDLKSMEGSLKNQIISYLCFRQKINMVHGNVPLPPSAGRPAQLGYFKVTKQDGTEGYITESDYAEILDDIYPVLSATFIRSLDRILLHNSIDDTLSNYIAENETDE